MTGRLPAPLPNRGGLLGAVLAGGESRRFGGEKALFPLLGRPMVEWALETLAPWTAAQVVIAPPGRIEDGLNVPVRPDVRPGLGPLGGLLTALGWAREKELEGVFLLACDLPLVPSALVGTILRRWPRSSLAVVPGSYGPLGFEPLCSAIDLRALPVVEAVLASGRGAMEEALVKLHAYRLPPETLGSRKELGRAFLNVNTREMAGRAEEVLRDQDRAVPGAPPAPSRFGQREAPGGSRRASSDEGDGEA